MAGFMKCRSSGLMTTEQFNLIEQYLPKVKSTRPCKYSKLSLFNGILYVLRTGCQWRMLPSYFPPWQSVYQYLRILTFGKYLDVIKNHVNRLYDDRYIKRGKFNKDRSINRNPPNYILVTDSQSVRCTECLKLDKKGYDGNKKIKGVKRFTLIDLKGCNWFVYITPANVSEKVGVKEMLIKYSQTTARPKEYTVVIADKGFESKELKEFVDKRCNLTFIAMKSNRRCKKENRDNQYNLEQAEIINKQNKQISTYRWIVEQGFSFLDKCRRLIVNYERTIKIHESFVKLCFIRIILNRMV